MGKMAIMDEHPSIWEEIDRAENYLVCSMFDEATSLASSILERLLENHSRSKKGCEIPENFDGEWYDMLESAGMVLVQSMKQLQRTSEILKELKLLFGSVTVIPVQVFLTGACFQMSEGLSTIVQGFLVEFLNNWIYVDGRYYPRSGVEARESDKRESCIMVSMEVDKYLEVVELYVATLLATTVKDTDLAISLVEKAMLPTGKRQDLLRRLRSMSSTVTSSSQSSVSPHMPDEYKLNFFRDQKEYNGHQKDTSQSERHSLERNTVKEEILKLSLQRNAFFWWFPTINLKLGNNRLVVPTGKMLLASLLLIVCYITRKKQAALKRVIAEKAVSVKKVVLDLWQLAFSYQVNPLAAVQPLPSVTRGSH